MTRSPSAPESGAVTTRTADLVVVGAGAAGLAAAVSALEADPALDVLVLERTNAAESGGNTKWSSSFFRTGEDKIPADGFEEDFAAFTHGHADTDYVRRLREETTATLRWVEGHGVVFEMAPMFFLTASRPRLGIRGGGASIVEQLGRVARELGATVLHETTATDLLSEGDDPRVTGVRCATPDGPLEISADAVVLASGGYEGDVETMLHTFGENAEYMKPVARGGGYNKGEGIAMALAAGASRTGEWSNFHGEPVDPRSNLCEPVVMTFPYGILVNADGERFVDEGSSTVDETYEDVCRAIFAQPGNISYLVADSRLLELDGYARATLTDRQPYTADTIAGLAKKLDVDAEALEATVTAFNAAPRPDGVTFDATVADGLSATGIDPVKTHWARPITEAPFVAIPVATAVCFTYGGIGVDPSGRVVREDGTWLRGLWAAGEMTGIYHVKYPGATSVLRSLVFGRLAAQDAAATLSRSE